MPDLMEMLKVLVPLVVFGIWLMNALMNKEPAPAPRPIRPIQPTPIPAPNANIPTRFPSETSPAWGTTQQASSSSYSPTRYDYDDDDDDDDDEPRHANPYAANAGAGRTESPVAPNRNPNQDLVIFTGNPDRPVLIIPANRTNPSASGSGSSYPSFPSNPRAGNSGGRFAPTPPPAPTPTTSSSGFGSGSGAAGGMGNFTKPLQGLASMELRGLETTNLTPNRGTAESSSLGTSTESTLSVPMEITNTPLLAPMRPNQSQSTHPILADLVGAAHSRQRMQEALVMREILGKPPGLRNIQTIRQHPQQNPQARSASE